MAETNDILDSMNKAMDTLNAVSKVTGDISSIGRSYNKRQKDKESGEIDRINLQIAIYDKKITRIIIFNLLFWLVLVISTIILCVTGNDIVLRLLHL